eukprot:Skav213722  [mRNA]  locus=scaffold2678:300532:301712:- [translate_table: standard]
MTRHQVSKAVSPMALLPPNEIDRIQAAVRTKALEAIAVGNLPPGKELELISALDLGTIPWTQLPAKLKEHLSLPMEDSGIDSLSLNLVQAKDYATGSTVPLSRLATFHLLVEGKGSKLKGLVEEMIVATSDGTQLPKLWDDLTGATQRKYSTEEIEAWRFTAQQASSAPERRACIIVPKLDLMEQMAQLLEELYPSSQISRVGTGWPANPFADVFVCVRNSAWQLANLTFDVVLFDEGHHYEPLPTTLDGMAGDQQAENLSFETSRPAKGVDSVSMTHTQQVLALQAKKRLFFTATLRRNSPDFDFGLRPAIEAGVIQDMGSTWGIR